MAITVKQCIQEMMLLWGIENPDSSAASSRARAMNDLNRSVQLLWANAENLNYFNQTSTEVTIPAGSSSIVLSETIQEVIGPVRLASSKAPLQPVATRYESENYANIYNGGASLGDIPLAYYLQTNFAGAGQDDGLAVTLFSIPAPTADTPIELDVVLNAPAYTYDDYCAATVIPIPHQYGESILLPVCRHAAMSHSLTVRMQERAPVLEAEYREARRLLGLVEPDVDEVRPDAKVADFMEFRPIPPVTAKRKS